MSAARAALKKLAAPVRQGVRNMSGGGHDDYGEMVRWRNVTYVAVPLCLGLGVYNLTGSHDHGHEEERPAYSYLHIRNKQFPWGPDGLFERKHH